MYPLYMSWLSFGTQAVVCGSCVYIDSVCSMLLHECALPIVRILSYYGVCSISIVEGKH